jgi:hypothetical protein
MVEVESPLEVFEAGLPTVRQVDRYHVELVAHRLEAIKAASQSLAQAVHVALVGGDRVRGECDVRFAMRPVDRRAEDRLEPGEGREIVLPLARLMLVLERLQELEHVRLRVFGGDRRDAELRLQDRERALAVGAVFEEPAGSKRALRFRLGRWLSPRTTSLSRTTQASAFVFGCWLVRGVACFILLGTLGLGYSFPLALLFLCAGAAAAALPIGPAGAATQAGAGTAALAAAGVGTSQALAASVSVAALGVFSGAAVLLFAVAWRTSRMLLPARTAA